MQNFADQCLDMARSMLGHNLEAINPDGTITPVDGENPRLDEPGHAALAIGEFYRATGETTMGDYDLVDLAARCITAQVFTETENENGLGYAALALLSFGPAKDRNPVWERLLDPTRERLDKRLLARTDYDNHFQAFNIAKAVARFSMGLSKKDETGKLIDRFVERISQTSSAGYFDDAPTSGLGGRFDIYGPMSLVFIRQSLQLHANLHLRERKLPSLRTVAEKYLKLLPDLVRQDGMAWNFGTRIGAYGQMHSISMVLQAMRDGWISDSQKGTYTELLRRIFQFFFLTYMDQERGVLVVRDEERDTVAAHTSRMADFDGTRYLCQWSRLAKSIGGTMETETPQPRTGGRFVIFDKSNKKEQGLFIYQDTESGLHVHLPLMSGSDQDDTCDYLPYPHCPGIFDGSVNKYIPVMIPELRFGDNVVIPAYYGKRCVTGLGLRRSFYFRYEQPDFITVDNRIIPNMGSVKVAWTFAGNKITSEYTFTVKNQVTLDSMRYMLAIASPHSQYHVGTTFAMGEEGLRCNVLKDDFQANWKETEVVTNDPDYKTYWGKVHYLQTLERDHPLVMRPGQQYKLTISFEPDVAFYGE